jgi:hypothetical protein
MVVRTRFAASLHVLIIFMSQHGQDGKWKSNSHFVVMAFCAYSIKELTARAEVKDKVDILRGLDIQYRS